MGDSLFVVGAGGFGRETLDVIEAVNRVGDNPALHVLGVLDDCPAGRHLELLQRRSIPYLGTVDECLSQGRKAPFVVGIGNPDVRQRIVARLEGAWLSTVSVVHPRAEIGSACVISAGSVICAGVIISTNVAIGRHVHLNPGCIVGHDTVLADFVSINPGAVVSGECRVEARALVGAGATVLQGLTVGAGSLVGAMACVTSDVAPGTTVKGVPAR